MSVHLYQTIRKNGRFYVRGYVVAGDKRREFSLTEITAEKAFETLARMRQVIDKVRG